MNPESLPLRDIHLPPDVSWWPPAPGWWLLLLLVVAAGVAGAWWRRRRTRHAPAVEPAVIAARRSLEELRGRCSAPDADARALAREASILLRRISMSLNPRRETAGLAGEPWLRFLDRGVTGRPFSTGPGRILVEAPYRRDVRADEVASMIELSDQWLASMEHRAGQGAP